MDFLKKHYEKIVLSLVLLGLAVAAAWLPAAINGARQDLQKSIVNLPEPILHKQVDLSTNETALTRLQNPPVVELSGAHNLFNPVTWKLRPDQTFVKILREGVDALAVTKIEPLFMELSLDRVITTGYFIGVKRLSKKSRPAKARSTYAKLNEKTELFTLREVKGPPEDPDELILELTDTQQLVSVTKAKPFERVEGYSADLRYEPDAKNFLDQRVNSTVNIGGEFYKIIAITENEVRVSAISTDKRTTILWKGDVR